MGTVTITLSDESKQNELLALVVALPYVESVQWEEAQGVSHHSRAVAVATNLAGNELTGDPLDSGDPTDREDPLDREIAAFEAQHHQLVKQFLGQFIAMYQGQVIAHKTELDTLITHVQHLLPNTPVLFRRVETTLPPPLFIRSPRLIRP